MNFRKLFLIIVTISFIGLSYFSYFIYKIMLVPNTAFESEKAVIYVNSNSNYDQVKSDLKPFLKDIETFDILEKQKKYKKNVRAGKFIIYKGMNNNDIINTIRIKNTPITLTFNNQNSIEKLAKRISTQIEPDSIALLRAFRDSLFLIKNGFTLENSLAIYLPNTYELFWNTSAEKLRSKLMKAYNNFWNLKRKKKAHELNMTPIQISILASIVQEESKQTSEQPKIAGVYINRLRNNWALQADPTLKFAAYRTEKYQGKIIKRVLNIHKKIKSPYNTYLNKGLPPGLIAMPDLSAIDAVLNYEKHSFFYFSADPNRPGFHNFSKNLKDHNKNAFLYHNYLNQKGIY